MKYSNTLEFALEMDEKDPLRDLKKQFLNPKTPEGKAKSAQNATKHGLTASHDVIKGESQEEFDAHRQGFLDTFNPQNAVEHFLADHAASLAWRLKRASRIQNEIVSGMYLDMPFVADQQC